MRRWYEDWERLNPILADGEVGEIIGMVQTKTGDGVSTWKELPFTPPAPESDSIPGLVTVRKFPFAFDTPDLLTGYEVYAPTAGDLLLDAWFSVTTPWDGTTPLGDIGAFAEGNTTGWFSNVTGAWNLTTTHDGESVGDGLLYNASGKGLTLAQRCTGVLGDPGPPSSWAFRQVPAVFLGSPIKIVVSQNAHSDGADPGSTQGSAILYLVTATPI